MNEMGPRGLSANRAGPPEIAARVAALGKEFTDDTPQTTAAIYVPSLKAVNWAGIDVDSDLAYGPDAERHLLDVHTPTDKDGAGLPTVIFFHGGGFVRGHKNQPNGVMYANIANTYASQGIVGVNATYRLAPDVQWPGGARDVGAALAWVRGNIADYGGDPDKIFLMGQSAGASHVATYAFRSELHPDSGPGFAGVILMSGVYGLSAGNASPGRDAYYGTDESKFEEMQVLGNVTFSDCPVFCTIGEFDTVPFEKSTLALINELTEKNGCAPRFKQLIGHNHISQVCCFGTEDTSISADMVDFVLTNA